MVEHKAADDITALQVAASEAYTAWRQANDRLRAALNARAVAGAKYPLGTEVEIARSKFAARWCVTRITGDYAGADYFGRRVRKDGSLGVKEYRLWDLGYDKNVAIVGHRELEHPQEENDE